MLLVRFVHYLGMAMWIGGGLAVAVLVAKARGESPQVRASLFGLLANVYTLVIGLGAFLTIGSGILWSMAIAGAGDIPSRVAPIGLWIMTAAGLVGGLLIAFVVLPTAVRMRAVAVATADGQMLPAFEQQRKRLLAVSCFAGVLAVVELFAAVLAP